MFKTPTNSQWQSIFPLQEESMITTTTTTTTTTTPTTTSEPPLLPSPYSTTLSTVPTVPSPNDKATSTPPKRGLSPRNLASLFAGDQTPPTTTTTWLYHNLILTLNTPQLQLLLLLLPLHQLPTCSLKKRYILHYPPPPIQVRLIPPLHL